MAMDYHRNRLLPSFSCFYGFSRPCAPLWPSGKASASTASEIGFEPRFSLPSHTSDYPSGHPVRGLALQGRNGWPGDSVLELSEMANLMCS